MQGFNIVNLPAPALISCTCPSVFLLFLFLQNKLNRKQFYSVEGVKNLHSYHSEKPLRFCRKEMKKNVKHWKIENAGAQTID